MPSTIIRVGDTRSIIASLPADSVQTIVTSPPYYGLRDYGIDGQIGLERTPQEYVDGLVSIFAECRRVLRSDGTLWLNIGDSYARDERKGQHKPGDPGKQAYVYDRGGGRASAGISLFESSLKPKDLIGIPWMLAFALRADGWYLRSDIIWHKPNALPESVRDRPGNTYEHVFLLAKSERYYYDVEAVKVKAQTTGTINLRNVWRITTKPFKGAHFATFPIDLVEPCIRAGSSERGICPCGASWIRQTGRPCQACDAVVPTQANSCPACGYTNDWKAARTMSDEYGTTDWSTSGKGVPRRLGASGKQAQVGSGRTIPIGWSPSCSCSAAPVPALVLDPFGGSGTTAVVANRLGRDAILLEINPDYARMSYERLISDGVSPDDIALHSAS